jgi:hypothetical protein
MRVGALVLVGILATCGCDSPARPTSTPAGSVVQGPLPVASDLEGMWVGTAQLLTCAGPACTSSISQPEPPRRFSLTVLDERPGFVALLDLDVRVHLVLEVIGTQGPDGLVTFKGSLRPVNLSQTADVDAFEVRLDPATGLSGTFTYRLLWPSGTTTVTGRIVSAERRLLSSLRDFGGQWSGDFVVTDLQQCVGPCMKVGSDSRLNLTLSQSGTGLSGQALVFHTLPVVGTVTGVSALIDGERPPTSCGYPGFDVTTVCVETIHNLQISLDRFGRMIGTLEYAREGWNGSSGGPSYYSQRVRGVLSNLLRQ